MTPAGPIALPDGHGWGSHLPALVHYVLRTRGPVLELGAGQWSTPVLHAMCAAGGRKLVTAEEDAAWRMKLAGDLAGEGHEFLASYGRAINRAGYWSVVLIDHAMDRRQADLLALGGRADVLVCHDTNCVKYGWDFSRFRHRRDWADLSPTTTAVSDVLEL